MKHLLIILISILLLSSFLTSCEKKEETLYRWETSSGWEWKTIGDKNNNPQYKGEVKREYIIFGDYIREGVGSLTYSDGDKYEGEWKDGQKHGNGIMDWGNGEVDEGEWEDGILIRGTKTSLNGNKIEGEWKDFLEWNTIETDKDGNIIEKYVNGVKQK